MSQPSDKKVLQSLDKIKQTILSLDMAAVRRLSEGATENVRRLVQEVRVQLKEANALAHASLKIAIIGEFNSGKTLLLNALIDTCDFFPCLLSPTTLNVLEAHVTLSNHEAPPTLQDSTVSFLNQHDVREIMRRSLTQLRKTDYGDLIPSEIEPDGDLKEIERVLCQTYLQHPSKSIAAQYNLLDFIEFVLAWRYYRKTLVTEGNGHYETKLDFNLVGSALISFRHIGPYEGVEYFYKECEKKHAAASCLRENKPLTIADIASLKPLIRRVTAKIKAWGIPFGVMDSDSFCPISFFDFPGIGTELDSQRICYLCLDGLAEAHVVLGVLNGSNAGSSNVSQTIHVLQEADVPMERLLLMVGRYDEFYCPVTDAAQYYEYRDDYLDVRNGFALLLEPAQKMLPDRGRFHLYLCSSLVYLFLERASRSGWNFGNPEWFNDSKRLGSFARYGRKDELENLITSIRQQENPTWELQQMQKGLECYLDRGGIPLLRYTLVELAAHLGGRELLSNALDALHRAQSFWSDLHHM